MLVEVGVAFSQNATELVYTHIKVWGKSGEMPPHLKRLLGLTCARRENKVKPDGGFQDKMFQPNLQGLPFWDSPIFTSALVSLIGVIIMLLQSKIHARQKDAEKANEENSKKLNIVVEQTNGINQSLAFQNKTLRDTVEKQTATASAIKTAQDAKDVAALEETK